MYIRCTVSRSDLHPTAIKYVDVILPLRPLAWKQNKIFGKGIIWKIGWIPDQESLLLNFLFIFFFAWLHYYKFSRIGRPVLGRYISVNKENVSLSHTYVYLTKKKRNKKPVYSHQHRSCSKWNPPAAHAKMCIYCISFHSVASNPRATGGCEPRVYNQFSDSLLCFFFMVLLFWWAFSDYYFVWCLLCVCVLSCFCFPQLFFFQ